jgi:hypothetical protein
VASIGLGVNITLAEVVARTVAGCVGSGVRVAFCESEELHPTRIISIPKVTKRMSHNRDFIRNTIVPLRLIAFS